MDTIEMWWLSLGIAAVVVVVVAILLGLIILTAKSIDRHAAAIWVAGKDIAGNTVAIWMLEQTNGQVGRMLTSVRSIDQSVASIDESLKAIADTPPQGTRRNGSG